jgi:hypothetical protein
MVPPKSFLLVVSVAWALLFLFQHFVTGFWQNCPWYREILFHRTHHSLRSTGSKTVQACRSERG